MVSGLEIGPAVTAFVDISVKISKLGAQSIRAFRAAKKEARNLITSASSFSSVLHVLCTTLRKLRDSDAELASENGTKTSLTQLSLLVQECHSKIKKALTRLEPFKDPYSSKLALFSTKVKWIIYDKHDLEELMASLEPLKSTISILQATLAFDMSLEVWRECHRTGQKMSTEYIKEIMFLKRHIKTLKRECHRSQRKYEAVVLKTSRNGRNTYEGLGIDLRDLDDAIATVETVVHDQASSSRAIIRELELEVANRKSSTAGSSSSARSSGRGTSRYGSSGTALEMSPPTTPREEGPRPSAADSLRSVSEPNITPAVVDAENETENVPPSHTVQHLPNETGLYFLIDDDGTLYTEEEQNRRVSLLDITASLIVEVDNPSEVNESKNTYSGDLDPWEEYDDWRYDAEAGS